MQILLLACCCCIIVDANTIAELQKEIEHVESQVDIWMKELAEINEARTNLDVRISLLRSSFF